MIIAEVHENGVQSDKLGLTESYVETLWRHGKQLLKGAAVLGVGILGYSAWRYIKREEAITPVLNTTDLLSNNALSPALNNKLLPTFTWQNDSNKVTESVLNKRMDLLFRRGADHCLTSSEIGEFQINTHTPYDQINPALTGLADGSFVVVWHSAIQHGIFGQRYSAAGTRLGNEFQVNTWGVSWLPVDAVISPAIAGLIDGSFVVVWWNRHLDGSGLGIYGQRYSTSGSRQGEEFRVNTYPYYDQINPAIAGLVDGSFVVVWTSTAPDVNSHIYGQRFTGNGTMLGGEFQVSNTTVVAQNFPVIAGLMDGGFIIVWTTSVLGSPWNSPHYAVHGRWYSTSGMPLGSEFSITDLISSDQSVAAVAALFNETFAVTFQAYDGSDNGISGHLGTASGTAYNEFQANTNRLHDQINPAIMALSNGNFAIVWQSDNQDSSGYDIYGQRFTILGKRWGSEFRVNTETANNQIHPAITGLLDGSFVVVWQSDIQDGSLSGIYGQRYWTEIQVGNSCDASYTEDIKYPLGLWIAPLAYISPMNATIILHPPTAGQLISLANPMANYNSTMGRWFATGSFTGVNSLLRELSFAPMTNYNQDITISILVHDETGSLFTGNFTLTGIPVNDPPVWVSNQLVISQGETRILTTANVFATDVDTPDSILSIMANDVQHGRFEFAFQPGIPIVAFTQQNISSGIIAFVHNNLAFEPSYILVVSDGKLTSELMVTVDFNVKPSIINNAFIIQKPGETVLLTNINIFAGDSDNLPNELLFTVGNVQHGRFQIPINPNADATTFTQQDINNNLVRFIHDGSKNAPTYNLIVNDGRVFSEISKGTPSFSLDTKTKIPYTETTGFKSGISIGITAVGTLTGFAAWRYRNDQDAKRRRQQSLIANIIRDDLNLAGVHDFTSERGVELLEAIAFIGKKLEKKEIDIIGMTRDEKENFAHKLAECLKTYVSHIPPKDVLEGNIVTQPTRHLYYQKIKPLLKPGAVWLDTDALKKAADVIATNVKVKLSEQEQDIESGSTNAKGKKSSVMMQPLLSHN